MKKHFSTILLVLIFLIGLSLLLYPTFSDYWNSFRQSKVITDYTDMVDELGEDEYKKILAQAKAYNENLAKRGSNYYMSDADMERYFENLDITGTGVMGYVEIPLIDVNIPLYHTTEEKYLQVALGHIEWSSLPVGGESSHCVISGHRGLPSAKLFTDLDKLKEGDTFLLHILNETYTYQVDKILIVLPEEVNSLDIVKGEDYCTLVTCTPYGINSHRLLVRGHRVETVEDNNVVITPDAYQVEPLIVATIVAAVILLVLLVIVLIKSRKRKTPEKKSKSKKQKGEKSAKKKSEK